MSLVGSTFLGKDLEGERTSPRLVAILRGPPAPAGAGGQPSGSEVGLPSNAKGKACPAGKA
ncbi:MAG TPA: hypothetical protein VKC51_10080, partial [Lacunisphaera sp.]|nr:hypothetical protein [Lacunisphaera sp.]